MLKQDPNSPGTVYAGTTEGLWKTTDGGKTWKHATNSEIVVNDVLIDPRNSNRVLLATDRSGVLASDNGAQTFNASNHGYTHRYVSSILADQNDPNAILVGVVNDRSGVESSLPAMADRLAAEECWSGRTRCFPRCSRSCQWRADCRYQQRHVPA